MKNLLRLSKATATGAIAVAILALHGVAPIEAQEQPQEQPSYYNPGEDIGSFEMVMKPYPIPVETTTYVDFVFNLPEDLPDLFHVVFADVINSQPLHLHHFVLTGCPNKFDVSLEGLPLEKDMQLERDCIIQLGGWAPGGNIFGNVDMDVGVLLGKGLGVEALRLNVHYTDGKYADEATKTPVMATDGMRIHYTTDFRPYTSIQKRVINIGFGPAQMNIPPGEPRFYITRTCKVQSSCKDADPRELGLATSFFGGMDVSAAGFSGDLSCQSIQLFCNAGGEIGPIVQQICPVSCGLCEDGTTGPLNPEAYRITSVSYHAHLLGREMYATLLREESDTDITTASTTEAVKKQSPSRTITATDLQSKEFWLYDDQGTIALDYDVDVVVDKNTMNHTILRGTEVKPGDKIQVTCVYDSSYRTENTIFGISTYDEMCITSVYITFETPTSLLESNGSENESAVLANANGSNAVDLLTEINLMSFSCESDEETDVYTGALTADEDARNIWTNHPIEDAEGCTFPVTEFLIASNIVTDSMRNCPQTNEGAKKIDCSGLDSNAVFVADAIAGSSCKGGTYDGRDTNEGFFLSDCTLGGGQITPYTCADIDSVLDNDAEASEIGISSHLIDYIVSNWYIPKCCKIEDGTESPTQEELDTREQDTDGLEQEEDKPNQLEPEQPDVDSSAAPSFSKRPANLALLSTVAVFIPAIL